MVKRIAISSAHGLKIRGAKGYLDEVNESRRVVTDVVKYLKAAGVTVMRFDDDKSTTQSANLRAIVSWHNAQKRELDVSIHFNAFKTQTKAVGTECLYLTQAKLAMHVAAGICYASGLIDRGAKKRTNLAFLKTTKPAILVEVCFVDSKADSELFKKHHDAIAKAIANAIR